NLSDHTQRPLAADKQLGQVQSSNVLESRSAQFDFSAISEHNAHAQHVVCGDAVFHAAQAASIRCDIAADRAELKRRRIRWIPEPMFSCSCLNLCVERAGLSDCRTG